MEDGDDGDDDDVEEYLPGGFHLKIVILPKGFTPDFREGWEFYRTDYWERENEIRVSHRKELLHWHRTKSKSGTPPPSLPQLDPATAAARVRKNSISSRPPSVSSRAGTPEPDSGVSTPSGRQRKGSPMAKRRPNLPPGLRPSSSASGDVSDSGSTTSALDESRRRRSESPVTDRSGSSTAGPGKRKAGAKGRGKGKKNAG